MTVDRTRSESMNESLSRLDEKKLVPYLEANIADFKGPVRIEKFSGGQSNPTYKMTTQRKSYVLRRKPPGEVLSSAHQVGREALVMGALRGTDVRVPEIYHHCEDKKIIGQEFYVMGFLEGRVFWDPLLPKLRPDERRSVYEALVDELTALHAIEPGTIGLAEFGPSGNYFRRQVKRWTKQYRAGQVRIDDMDWLADCLLDNIPDQQSTSIVHGDYRLDNAVFTPDCVDLMGLLDWELATLGSPLADLSYFSLGWRVPLTLKPGPNLVTSDLKELGIPQIEEIHERYFEQSGLSPPSSFDFYHAYNLFRLGAILHGIGERARKGNASSEQAAKLAVKVPMVAALARNLCR